MGVPASWCTFYAWTSSVLRKFADSNPLAVDRRLVEGVLLGEVCSLYLSLYILLRSENRQQPILF